MLDLAMDGWRYQLLRSVPRRQVVSLSSRELEIARMIANGHTNRTVAVVLDISPWTVSTHLRRVFAKLNVGSRAAMVARLVAEGLIVPPNGMGRTSR
jgi:DNA-binding CsgD family transcriptional regulator